MVMHHLASSLIHMQRLVVVMVVVDVLAMNHGMVDVRHLFTDCRAAQAAAALPEHASDRQEGAEAAGHGCEFYPCALG